MFSAELFVRSIFLTLFCFLPLMSCAKSVALEKQIMPGKNSHFGRSPEVTENNSGWNYVINKLRSDGVEPDKIQAVFGHRQFPEFTFVPFKLNPQETTQMYGFMTSAERLDRAMTFLDKYRTYFEEAEKKFEVTRFVIAAIISVETNWGSYTGNELVVYRLARIVSTAEDKNLGLNFVKFASENPDVQFEQARLRAQYLQTTFYPHLLALFELYSSNPSNLVSLKGSVAGAYGLPQFLPKSVRDYGVDANSDRTVDLFSPEDAIFSVANFLKSHGWKKLLPPQDKLAVLWHYNRSDAYGRAVIRVALSLQNRVTGLI